MIFYMHFLISVAMAISLPVAIKGSCDETTIDTFDGTELGSNWDDMGTHCSIVNNAVQDVSPSTSNNNAVEECWAKYLPDTTNATGARLDITYQSGSPVAGILLGLGDGDSLEETYDDGYGILVRLEESANGAVTLFAYNGQGRPVGIGLKVLEKPASEFDKASFIMEALLNDEDHLVVSLFGFDDGSNSVEVDFGEYTDIEKMGTQLGIFLDNDDENEGAVDDFIPLCAAEKDEPLQSEDDDDDDDHNDDDNDENKEDECPAGLFACLVGSKN